MNDFLKNLSAYDLISIFVPGTVVVAVCDKLGVTQLLTGNVAVAAVACYVFGVVASRIGSIVLEPIAIRAGAVSRGEYADYIKASSSDEEIGKLAMVAASYRSLLGAMVACLVLFLVSLVPEDCRFIAYVVLAIAVAALMLASWFKQEGYIRKRIDAWREGAADDED